MRPPLAGKRAAALRLAEQVRRRLKPVERVNAAPSVRAAATPPAPAPHDAAARIDAARERLRATIVPPSDEDCEPDPGREEGAR